MKNRNGFSLIELILVISIIIILGASSGVFYSRFLNQNSVSNVSDEIAESMHKAQVYAMMGRNNSNWGVKLVGNTLTLFSSASAAFNENFTINNSISITGLTTVNFTKATGIPDATPTITVSGSGNTKTLTINSQGVVNR